MQISKEQVRHVAKLARLEITEAGNQETFSRQLSSILTHIEQLKSWDRPALNRRLRFSTKRTSSEKIKQNSPCRLSKH